MMLPSSVATEIAVDTSAIIGFNVLITDQKTAQKLLKA